MAARNNLERLGVWVCMGVLHMAIPAFEMGPRSGLRSPGRFAVTMPVPDAPGGPAVRSTLRPTGLIGGKSERAGVNRTAETAAAQAEREAAQEATARLARRCMAGDQQAWQQMVALQHRRIYAICFRFTGSCPDAEDLTQDVFLKVYRNLASFDVQKGSFQTWMTTLARNLLVDHFRRTRLERASESLDASFEGDPDGPTMGDRLADTRAGQDRHVAGMELRAVIQEALKQLSPELREAVILRDLEDLDYKEIAEVLRIPEGTVKSRISRGRGELARLLKRIEGQVV